MLAYKTWAVTTTAEPTGLDTTRCIASIPAGWPHEGQTYCCPAGTTRYGDGSACCPGGSMGSASCSGTGCAIYGNAGLDRCDGITHFPTSAPTVEPFCTMIGKMDYATCQAQCAAGGMMMPCLKSAEDEAALADAYNGSLTVWIALDDLETQGTYEWQETCDSDLVLHTNWLSGQPNHADQRCVGHINDGWGDWDCNDSSTVDCCCQPKPPTAEPTAEPTAAPTTTSTTQTPTPRPVAPPTYPSNYELTCRRKCLNNGQTAAYCDNWNVNCANSGANSGRSCFKQSNQICTNAGITGCLSQNGGSSNKKGPCNY